MRTTCTDTTEPSAGGAAQDRGPKRGPALFGTQEQVDAEPDLVERAVVPVGVAAIKKATCPSARPRWAVAIRSSSCSVGARAPK
jgi:hypothetical protein